MTEEQFYGHASEEFDKDASCASPAMHIAHNASSEEHDDLAQCFFADESAAFRFPMEPGIYQQLIIRLRVDASLDAQVALLVGAEPSRVPMRRVRADKLFSWFEATIWCGLDSFTYRYDIVCAEKHFIYQKCGARKAEDALPKSYDFRIKPGFHIPTWAKGALQYQIFPDRFANGNTDNDVVDAEYSYDSEHVRKAERWDALPAEDDYRCFYGGDLQGVRDKLDYLQSLGVEAIYLNPIFVSPSSHKYDTQDYEHVDPHLAVIVDDNDHALPKDVHDNAQALRYITRTTSQANLEQSDALFADLCREIHSRGMRIILDGVFNHCGSFSRWMDGEGIYRHAGASKRGAYQNPDSPYRHFFNFLDDYAHAYEGWWDFPTLPKLNYENSNDLVERVIGVARKWAMPPYSIDGWRLDVAADLGYTESFNHAFWRRFRKEIKQVNPELLIVAEHYGDASEWLKGDQWDTVMNYDAFMDPLTFFLTGMEKHSDYAREELYQQGEEFWDAMLRNMAHFSWGSLLCAMNELSNHDHSRFLTRTNRMAGRTHTVGPEAAGEKVDKRVLREAVVVQMTWPGAPTIYYGDEAGLVGWTDPDCRRTYPWGAEDENLIELHRELARIRAEHPSLRDGSLAPLGGGHGWIAYGRFSEGGFCCKESEPGDCVAVACNNLDETQVVQLRLRTLGIPDGCAIASRLRTTDCSFIANEGTVGQVNNGTLAVRLPAKSAAVLCPLACE